MILAPAPPLLLFILLLRSYNNVLDQKTILQKKYITSWSDSVLIHTRYSSVLYAEQSAAPQNNDTAVNPLDELGVAIEEFKLKIKAMLDESAVLSRKVKEVALSQKQKERDFIQARRAIERIRMAI